MHFEESKESGDYMRNNTYLKLESVYRKYRGYVKTGELVEDGFSNRQIAVLTEEGYLERVCHGYYWLKGGQCEKPVDYKCIEVCLSNPNAVICMDSAIYYQEGMAEEPPYISVATERTDRSLMRMNFLIKRHYFSGSNFRIGMRKKNTEFGCYNIYDIERSVCDLSRLKQGVEIEIINHVRNDKQRFERLWKYVELFGIKQQI